MAATAEDTSKRVTLEEHHLELKVGDYLHRLRQASQAKFYGSTIHWGPCKIVSHEEGYLFYDIDGGIWDRLPRDDYEVEMLVAQFDQMLEDNLNDL